ncbi:MAG: hypothetical protein MI976_15520 [Pseudomonadales bacterium]|nr:hypothetical protein [Pseudomonadales bacterium]
MMERKLRKPLAIRFLVSRVLTLCLLTMLVQVSQAENQQLLAKHGKELFSIYATVKQVDYFTTACERQNSSINTAALENWHAKNQTGRVKEYFRTLSSRSNDVRALIAQAEPAIEMQATQVMAKSGKRFCDSLTGMLQQRSWNPAQQHAQLISALSPGATTKTTNSAPPSSNRRTTKVSAKNAAKIKSYKTRPGAGIPQANIKGIYYWLGGSYSSPYGMMNAEAYFLLLKDGQVWKSPDTPPEDTDITKAQKEHPKRWGKYQKRGDSYELTFPNKKPYKLPLFQLSEMAVNDRIQGQWHARNAASISMTNDFNVQSLKLESLYFDHNGRFEIKKAISAGFTGGSGAAAQLSERNARSGTYSINSYTIELNFYNGKTERLLIFATNDKDIIFIGGKRYKRKV